MFHAPGSTSRRFVGIPVGSACERAPPPRLSIVELTQFTLVKFGRPFQGAKPCLSRNGKGTFSAFWETFALGTLFSAVSKPFRENWEGENWNPSKEALYRVVPNNPPASWGTESRLRFLNFATFRSAVDTADSANSPARVKTGGRQGSVVGRGRFELPTVRPRKGFRV